jgi:hypothetical protein
MVSRLIAAPGLLGLLLGFLPLWSAPSSAETLAIVSDLNGRYGSTSYHQRVDRAAERLVAWKPDLVLSAGDMVAGQAPAGLEDETLEAMWTAFAASFIGPLAGAGIPLAVTAGNHDGSAYPGFERDRQAFERHWQDRVPPGLLPGSEWPWRYAIRHGGLLAITFDGTLPGAVPVREQDFVRAMLEAHGKAASWTVVWSHLPFWPLAKNREREIIRDAGFLALLHDQGVDAYVSGHHHLYFAGVDDAGMLHVSVAALGGNARRFATGGDRQSHGMTTLARENGRLLARGWLAPDFQAVVEHDRLPESIHGPAGTLVRIEGPVSLRD